MGYLATHCDNLNEKAQHMDPVVGRDKEIDEVIGVLSRKNKNNPALVGEPGVGKTVRRNGKISFCIVSKVDCTEPVEVAPAAYHINFSYEEVPQEKMKIWVVAFDCLQHNPVKWVTERITVKSATKEDACNKAREELSAKKYAFLDFIYCNESEE